MWYFGDYEIFHTTSVHLRREERGHHRPVFWKLSTPYVSVKFRKTVRCGGGYLSYRLSGEGHIVIDGDYAANHRENSRIELSPGEHIIEIFVSKLGGLPAAFVESDVCPGGAGWECSNLVEGYSPVGFNEYFDSADKNPEVFPFEYKNLSPVSAERFENGVLYDFGTEIFSYLNLSFKENRPLTVFYGESREEALDTAHSYIFEELSGEKVYRLRQRAFRYVYLSGDFSEALISADFEYLPLEARGSFECDEPVFNDICSVAAYTFHLNCREGFLDGIKRDRWIWSGDAYQSARINRYLFFDKEIEQRTLIGLVGKPPVEQHLNTIIDYSLLWMIGLYEHYLTYGDREFLRRIYPMATELLRFVESRINSDGFIEAKKGIDWTFVDWARFEKIGAVCAEQMLLIKAYDSMAYIFREIEAEGADVLSKNAARLKTLVNEYYWCEEKGAFIDSYISGNKNVTRHANIFAVMYGIATDKQTESILKNVLKNDNIPKITTPYFESYELDVLAKLGEFEALEELIRSYYGGMLKLGAKTIWEEYDPSMSGIEHYAMYGGKYHKSLCHAWGAGPIYLFGRYYLGVYATSPGYETFNVEPRLGGLGQIRGSVPVNGGEVALELSAKGLSVMATKAGGTLIYNGKSYSLTPFEKITVS